jgi:hypothetical protein
MRLSNFTLKRKLKKESSGFIAVLHFTVTVGSLILVGAYNCFFQEENKIRVK